MSMHQDDDFPPPRPEVIARPLTIEDAFFLLNQQAVVTGALLNIVSSMLDGDRRESVSQFDFVVRAQEKLERRIDALVQTGHARVQ